ncbi:hypothetical protein Bbelb_060790 [Branchiostoma belcheri]|nr:hypothetical protein Bbelb_060790 [Branchiostoma belcheri]
MADPGIVQPRPWGVGVPALIPPGLFDPTPLSIPDLFHPTPLSIPDLFDPAPLSIPDSFDPTPLSSPDPFYPTPCPFQSGSNPGLFDPTPLSVPGLFHPTPLSVPGLFHPTPLSIPDLFHPTPLSVPDLFHPTPLSSPYLVDPTPLSVPGAVLDSPRVSTNVDLLQARFWIRVGYPDPCLSLVLDKTRFWICQCRAKIPTSRNLYASSLRSRLIELGKTGNLFSDRARTAILDVYESALRHDGTGALPGRRRAPEVDATPIFPETTSLPLGL